MAPIAMPLTVHHDGRAHELVIEAAEPRRWGEVRAAVCAELGLAAETVLHYGVGPARDDWLIGAPPLLAGCELSTEPGRVVPERPPVVLEVIAGPDAGRWVAVGPGRITIGRGDRVRLPLTDPAVSLRHAELVCDERGTVLRDLGSTNGVFVDGCEVAEAVSVRTGAIIRVGGTILRIRLTVDVGGSGGFRPDGAGYLVREAPAATPNPPGLRLPVRPLAPGAPPKRAVPVVAAVVGAAVGAGLAMIMRNPLFLAFAALGPVTMIGTALADRLRGRRSRRRERREYQVALGRWDDELAAAADVFRRAAWQYFPSAAELVDQVDRGGPRIWERRRDTPGYLAAVIGSGRLRVTGGTGPELEHAMTDGDAERRIETDDDAAIDEVAADLSVADMPQIIHLGGVWGFAGRRGAARWLLAHLLATHSPADIRLRLITPQPDLQPLSGTPHAAGDGADLITVLDGAAAITSPAGVAALRAAAARQPGDAASSVTVICLVDDAPDLPAAAGRLPPQSTALDAAIFAQLCRGLSRLRDRSADALPPSVDLATITGPLPPGVVEAGWRTPTATATIGYGPGQSITTLDLEADGPHLLIAGTTGSGKSELLQTLITSWALAAPPSVTTMLLIDYKGGAAFGELAGLPHVVGLLTDLDPVLSARALTSLRAEVHRRERLVAAGQPAPRLIIVIDEFATLAVELPAFLQGLVDIAQRGRSLGIHLVLATQRPAGVVTPAMRANISARICLRVTDPAESIDVIGIPDAAAISQRTPGRAILTTGAGRSVVQTARATGALTPPLRIRRIDDGPAPGLGDGAGDGSANGAVTNSAGTFTTAVLAAIRAAHGDGPLPPAPWVPPLPEVIAEVGDDQLLAVADLPQQQCHRPVPVPDGSTLICGPPRSGRTTALRRIAAAAAARGEEIIVIDDAGDLADLASWPEVSTYLTRADPALLLRLCTVLTERSPDRIRHLLIDRYDLVSVEVERADFATGAGLLAEIAAHSTIRLTVTGPAQLQHGRLASHIPSCIELTGPSLPGRGEWDGTQIQVITCPPHSREPSTLPRALFADPVIIRPLPQQVADADLPSGTPEQVPIGIGGDAAVPFTIELATGCGAIIVTGPRRSGISTALAVMAGQARAAGIPTWIVGAAPRRTAAASRVFAIRDGGEELRAALAAHIGPSLLVVDDATVDHPAAGLLETFLDHCEPGQYLVIGARSDDLTRARRGYLSTALGHRRGLLLCPDPTLGMLLDLRVPRRSGPVTPGRGLWVEGGVGQPVQVALP